MKQILLAVYCILLTILVSNEVLGTPVTVRPYKFGFTIEEQQHRAESKDEHGIVMGEFGFITADGIYHVTVYATDENGKFRIISMKSYPYAGSAKPKTPSLTTTTIRTTPQPTPKVKLSSHNFQSEACSGCFLKKPSPTVSSKTSTVASQLLLGKQVPKTEIRPLSHSLAPSTAAGPGEFLANQLPFSTGSTAHTVVAEGVNVQLPFQQSIANTISAVLADGVAHTNTATATTNTHNTANPQHTTPVQGLSSGNVLLINSKSSHFDNAQKQIEPSFKLESQTSTENKNLNAFGSPLKSSEGPHATSLVNLQLPVHIKLNLAGPQTVQDAQQSSLQVPSHSEPLSSASTSVKPLKINVASEINNAHRVILDLDKNAFGTASRPKIAAEANNGIKSHSIKSSPKDFIRFTELQNKASIAPAKNLANDKSVNIQLSNENTYGIATGLKTPKIDLSTLPQIAPAATGLKDIKSHTFGQLTASPSALSVESLIGQKPGANSKLEIYPVKSTFTDSTGTLPKITIAAAGSKDIKSQSFDQLSTSPFLGQTLIGRKTEDKSKLEIYPVKSTFTDSTRNFANSKPVNVNIVGSKVNVEENASGLKTPILNLSTLPKISPAETGPKDIRDYSFGQLSTSPDQHSILGVKGNNSPNGKSKEVNNLASKKNNLEIKSSFATPKLNLSGQPNILPVTSHVFGQPSIPPVASNVGLPLVVTSTSTQFGKPNRNKFEPLQRNPLENKSIFEKNSPTPAGQSKTPHASLLANSAADVPSTNYQSPKISSPLTNNKGLNYPTNSNPSLSQDRTLTSLSGVKNVNIATDSRISTLASNVNKPLASFPTNPAQQRDVHLVSSAQQKVNSLVGALAHSGKAFSAAKRINSHVVGTMKDVVVPTAKFANQKLSTKRNGSSENNAALSVGQQINATPAHTHATHAHTHATPAHTQATLAHTHATPAHTQSNTHTAKTSQPSAQFPKRVEAVGSAVGTGFPSLTTTKTPKQQQQPFSSFSATPKPISNTPTLSSTPTNSGTGQTYQTGVRQIGDKQKNAGLPGTQGISSATLGNVPKTIGSVGLASKTAGAPAAGHSQADQTGDLYRFKYVLDYNGHEETGSSNGNKQGNYFAIGDDSVIRTIEYLANEFGYQPHIHWRKLDKNDAVLPKENSLKHYEFKWFKSA